jgi:hypothetical protein
VRVGFGRKLPRGYLPVFSTNTEEEAKELIVMCCPLGYDGHYYARELAHEQTLENLQRFSDKLAHAWTLLQNSRQRRPPYG